MTDSTQRPKSAYEIAMERLRQNDRDAGIESQPLTDEQKAAIAEIRNYYQAKLAEQDILHQSRLAGMMNPAERMVLEEHWRRERERMADERETKIAKIRAQPAR